ncbi:MAG: recombination mediator RecR [Bacteroidota bacterium]|nr:recombination mediator RecR [Bacteroidota bacterium]MDX5428527.1 recombination mediator RecR [Bacteroidota bacterium]MDX5446980.1 recombination mediator RecR [Bacteroidota bacterium]MDX5506284.1 recombination mediator RecR [Bacteroidota bacterium]
MNYSSKILENAVEHISKLPGIGKKSALRLALFLLHQDEDDVLGLSRSLERLKTEVRFCKECHNISDTDLCDICADPTRDERLICVVEDIRDVIAIEATHNYKGKYHILGGLISPMDGIGPGQLNIHSLIERVREKKAYEVLLALNATMEGDTTNFYIYRKLQEESVQITTIARGIAVGDALEYTDEITLGRSIENRIPFEQSLRKKDGE